MCRVSACTTGTATSGSGDHGLRPHRSPQVLRILVPDTPLFLRYWRQSEERARAFACWDSAARRTGAALVSCLDQRNFGHGLFSSRGNEVPCTDGPRFLGRRRSVRSRRCLVDADVAAEAILRIFMTFTSDKSGGVQRRTRRVRANRNNLARFGTEPICLVAFFFAGGRNFLAHRLMFGRDLFCYRWQRRGATSSMQRLFDSLVVARNGE